MYSRLAVLPDPAEPLQRGQLVAALSVGTAIIHLRRIAPQLGLAADLDAALADFARPDVDAAAGQFAAIDQRLAELSEPEGAAALSLRARGQLLSIRDALVQHHDYFDARE